jgi:hypothetical protein
MEPLQYFLTNQSQAHQEGLVVKVAPLLSKRVLWGKGDKGMIDLSLAAQPGESSLGPV